MGNRKMRQQRKQCKVPELGYYLLVIKVVETKTRTMIDKCMELIAYDAQYRIPWIIFDRDQVQGFAALILDEYMKLILGISIQRLMSRYTKKYANLVMKTRQFK